MSMNDINRLSHTSWNCKYHIVFAPKYRRKVFYKEKRAMIGKILRQLCEWKGVKIIEAEACPDHIHLFVEIPPKISVSGFMGYLKGKSAAMMYEQFGDLKYLMLWFSRPEFDRYARFKSHGSVREVMDWDEMCKVELPVPSYEEQKQIVEGYKTITERISLKKQVNDNLAA